MDLRLVAHLHQRTVNRTPHLRLDPLQALLEVTRHLHKAAVGLFLALNTSSAFLQTLQNDRSGHVCRNLVNLLQGRKQAVLGVVHLGRHQRQLVHGRRDHRVGDGGAPRENGAQTNAGEREAVVVFRDVVAVDGLEGRARGDQRTVVGPPHDVHWERLVQACWVRKRENNRLWVVLVHLLDHLLGEGARLCQAAHKHRGLDLGHHVHQALGVDAVPLRVWVRVPQLALARVLVQLEHHTAAVHDGDLLAGVLHGQAVRHHVVDDLVRHTQAGRTGAVDQNTRVEQVTVGELERGRDGRHDNSASALDVVVERGQLRSVAMQHGAAGGDAKVLVVQHGQREPLLDRLDEAVHKVPVLLSAHTLKLVAHVQVVVLEVDVVGADVQHHRQNTARVDTGTERHETQLGDGNTDAAHALVSNAQNALSVTQHNVVDVLVLAIGRQALVDGVRVRNVQETALGLAEPVRVGGNGVSLGWSIDDGQHLADVVAHQLVVQDLVLDPHGREEIVLGERRLQVLELGVRPFHLFLQRVDFARKKPQKPKRTALFLRERRALVENGRVEQLEARQVTFDGAFDRQTGGFRFERSNGRLDANRCFDGVGVDGFSRRETHAKLGLGPISDKQHTGGEKNGSGGYIYGEGRMSWGPGRTGMSRNRHVDTGRLKCLWKAVSRVACNACNSFCNVVVRVFLFFSSQWTIYTCVSLFCLLWVALP